MNFLNQKGIPLEKQLQTWSDIVKRPLDRHQIDCYTRTRQILMNGIEVESWNFKHNFSRNSNHNDLNKYIAMTRRIETMQQILVNWLTSSRQSVLDTTLAYEQVAVDLTAWLAKNEDDEYVKETFNFGLLEDFDHLYRYSQFAYLIEGTNPNEILNKNTDVLIARPTQYHHNCNALRIRKPYDKNNASIRTKINILTLLSAEQQTHNFYSEHGFMYGSADLKKLYAEICSVEEEHVTMYESLIDPTETLIEKWLLRELMECCCYYNCYKDETDERLKLIWEELLQMEIGHLHIAANMMEKYENRSAIDIIGEKEIYPCHFESQKDYVAHIIEKETNKRIDKNGQYNTVDNLDDSWPSYKIQEMVNKNGSPSEQAIRFAYNSLCRDVVSADKELLDKQDVFLEKSLEKYQAPNTVSVEMYKNFKKIEFDNYLC